MSKRMTLIIGAFCINGVVFCSDTEEGTIGGGKRDVHKLFEFSGDECQMVVGTAGFGPLCDVAVARIETASKSADFWSNHETKLGEVMAGLYKQYIPYTLPEWKQQDRQISLIIGLVDKVTHERFMYQTTEEIVQPIQGSFACAGVGQEIAYYLLDRLFDPALRYHEVSELVTFVMREAKSSVGGVGGNTEMTIMLTDATGVTRSRFGPGWDSRQPRLAQQMSKFWVDTKQ